MARWHGSMGRDYVGFIPHVRNTLLKLLRGLVLCAACGWAQDGSCDATRGIREDMILYQKTSDANSGENAYNLILKIWSKKVIDDILGLIRQHELASIKNL